jgi:hypothetical protein
MQKLLNAYKISPSQDNLKRLIAYSRKHPFASIMLNAEDAKLLMTLENEVEALLKQARQLAMDSI